MTRNSIPRENELIGSGFIVLARSTKDGVLLANKTRHPFEHKTLKAAASEADRLNEMESNDGKTFAVFVEIKAIPARSVDSRAIEAQTDGRSG